MCWITDDLQPVIDEYSEIIDERAQKLYAEGKVSSLHEDESFTRRLLLLAKEVPEVATNLDIMQARGEATFNFLKNPKILDVAESLCGSEIVCNPIQHIRAVLPHRATGGSPTHFHQDIGVCWPDTDQLLYADHVWVPVVDATLENGCLAVLPGSHKYGLRQHAYTPGLDIVPEEERPPIQVSSRCPSPQVGLSCSTTTRCITRSPTSRTRSVGALTCAITMPICHRAVPSIRRS